MRKTSFDFREIFQQRLRRKKNIEKWLGHFSAFLMLTFDSVKLNLALLLRYAHNLNLFTHMVKLSLPHSGLPRHKNDVERSFITTRAPPQFFKFNYSLMTTKKEENSLSINISRSVCLWRLPTLALLWLWNHSFLFPIVCFAFNFTSSFVLELDMPNSPPN